MLIRHSFEDGVLHVSLPHDLDVTGRPVAALETELLVHVHRPRRVRVQLPTFDPSPAGLGALSRIRRLCEALGIPLTVVGPVTVVRRLTPAPDPAPDPAPAPGADSDPDPAFEVGDPA
ncbi:hypothetical protein SLA_2884 [Streptomyces laurentii]|uniref:STAS domain-containing protein n=1 Tax=Streptomyces laurentii TaxID=39478 RepID=A0A160P0C2_STRLU|nr:hypothetical protein SLA_2884 [Streptomyces laurentii]